MKVIAYLAPEIPSLSGTFVYGEIFALQKQNFQIIPLSIHRQSLSSLTDNLEKLRAETTFLYERKWTTILQDNIYNFTKNPWRYMATCVEVCQDMLKLGLFNSQAIKLLYQFAHSNTVARILNTNHCEHLHIHFASVPTQVGMYAAKLASIPFSFTSHANDLFERGSLLKEKFTRCKFAVTISQYNYQFLQQQGDRPKQITEEILNKIQVVHCGVALENFPFQTKQKFSKKILIKSLGRLVEKKGFDTLVLAASELQKKGIDFHIEIGGDGPEKEKLINLIAETGLQSYITLVGSLPHQKILAWLKESDIFVLACKIDKQGDQDGIPVVLMEAMAIGIPVISTHLSGIPELIQDGSTGFLAEPNNPLSLATKIQDCLALDNQIAQLTNQARSKIEKDFNIEITTTQLAKLFAMS